MTQPESHDERVRRSFEQQVDLFKGEQSVFARRAASLEWAGPLDPEWTALDVACGAGHQAQALAPHVHQVVGIDLTRAVLEAGQQRLSSDGVRNVLLQEGDAAAMPFLDSSFDLVVCRASLHHFENPARQVEEMARVCRAGGRVVLSDMVAAPASTRERFDEVHRWIDPSHDRVLLPEEMQEITTARVGTVVRAEVGAPTIIALDSFVTDQSDLDRVLAALDAEVDGGEPTGFSPTRTDAGFDVRITTMVIHATPTG